MEDGRGCDSFEELRRNNLKCQILRSKVGVGAFHAWSDPFSLCVTEM